MLGFAMTALLLATEAQAGAKVNPSAEPPGVPIAPPSRLGGAGAPVAPPRKVVDAGAATLAPMVARFPEWYSNARTVVETARQTCPDAKVDWCGKYWGPSATEFDVEPLMQSKGLAVASFLVAPVAIQGAFAEFPVTRGLTAETIRKAGGGVTGNSGLLETVGLPLPGLDLEAQVQKVMEGIAAALQERAEQEAVLYALEVFDREVCTTEVRPFLPNTCTLSSAGAFSGTQAAGGPASLELLRNALETDARALPGNIGREVVRQAYDRPGLDLDRSTLPTNADALGRLLDDLVRGVRPERALDTFSMTLTAGDPDGVPTAATARASSQRAIRLLACGAGVPASFIRSARLIEATVDDLSPNERGVALGLLGLEEARCSWLYEAVWGPRFEGVAFKGGKGRLKVWARFADTLSAAAHDINDAEHSFFVARDSVEDAIEAARGKLDPATVETVARAVADGVFAALDAADAMTRLSSRLVAAARTAPLTPEGQAQVARLQASIDGAALAIRRVRGYGELVHAAASRDHGKTIQAAVRTASATDVSGTPFVIIPATLQRSLGLVVAIVDAKDPTEVKKALLAAAAPPGSWRLKYAPGEGKGAGGRGTVTLGGLVGLGASNTDGQGWDTRLLMPVGFDWVVLSWRPEHVSVFLQVLDVAGYAVQGDRKPRALQGVVPGASLKVSLGRSPFAAFAGGTYALDDGRETAKPAWRFNAGVAVDVSLFVLNRP